MAFVGAGGKSSILFALGKELANDPALPAVLATTSTHLAEEQARLADVHIVVEHADELQLPSHGGLILVTGPPGEERRLSSPGGKILERMYEIAQQAGLPLLIEADGARMKPIKAPGEHEPAIPPFVEAVVVVAGMQGLGKALNRDNVHRFERFAALSGLQTNQDVTASALTRELLHPEGGLKNIPQGARRVVVLNQADTPELQAMASGIAEKLLTRYDSVLVVKMNPDLQSENPDQGRKPEVFAVHERTAGVVLAAGEAVRFGSPKLLLPWRGEPIIRHPVRAALTAGLDPVVVVAGEYLLEIQNALRDMPVMVIENPRWKEGQSTSLQTGLASITRSIGGVIFLLADQPQVPVGLIRALVETHASHLEPITAPLVDGQRGNPVLFDASTFPDLMALRGDVGGRAPLCSLCSRMASLARPVAATGCGYP